MTWLLPQLEDTQPIVENPTCKSFQNLPFEPNTHFFSFCEGTFRDLRSPYEPDWRIVDSLISHLPTNGIYQFGVYSGSLYLYLRRLRTVKAVGPHVIDVLLENSRDCGDPHLLGPSSLEQIPLNSFILSFPEKNEIESFLSISHQYTGIVRLPWHHKSVAPLRVLHTDAFFVYQSFG